MGPQNLRPRGQNQKFKWPNKVFFCMKKNSKGNFNNTNADSKRWIFANLSEPWGLAQFGLHFWPKIFNLQDHLFQLGHFPAAVIKRTAIIILVGCGRACAPVLCAHPSFLGQTGRCAPSPPIAASLLHIHRPKNINLLSPETKSSSRPKLGPPGSNILPLNHRVFEI